MMPGKLVPFPNTLNHARNPHPDLDLFRSGGQVQPRFLVDHLLGTPLARG